MQEYPKEVGKTKWSIFFQAISRLIIFGLPNAIQDLSKESEQNLNLQERIITQGDIFSHSKGVSQEKATRSLDYKREERQDKFNLSSQQRIQEEESEEGLQRQALLPHQFPLQVLEKKKEVKESLRCSRIFYIFFHIFCLSLLYFYDNDLKDQIAADDLDYPAFCIFIIIITTYLFWTSGNNPGYAPYEAGIELQVRNDENDARITQNIDAISNKSVRASKIIIPNNSLAFDQPFVSKEDEENFENQYVRELDIMNSQNIQDSANRESESAENIDEIQIQKEQSSPQNDIENYQTKRRRFSYEFQQQLESFKKMEEDDDDEDEEEEEKQYEYQNRDMNQGNQNKGSIARSCKTSGTDFRSSDKNNAEQQQEEQEYVAELFYCKRCNRHQPFRSRHCDDCNRCIHKFDHHCFWIGGCVGELNHRKFWLFLLFQTIEIHLMFQNFLKGLDRYVITDEKGIETYVPEYCAYAIACFILFIFFLFTGVLSLYHTFLICTNQTTWEHNKRTEISYIRQFPKGFYPFSKGICRNIFMTFFHNGQCREWVIPSITDAEEIHKNSINVFENKYYNCC